MALRREGEAVSVVFRTGWGPDASRQLRSVLQPPHSIAERWAMLVVKALESKSDLKTLNEWAKYVGVSYSSLRETCRLLDLRPQKARDFMRALRALIHSRAHQCEPAALLDIRDHRTLQALAQLAGPCFTCRGSDVSPIQFIRLQGFIPTRHEGIRSLLVHYEDVAKNESAGVLQKEHRTFELSESSDLGNGPAGNHVPSKLHEAFWSSVEQGLRGVASSEDGSDVGSLVERTGAYFWRLVTEVHDSEKWCYFRVAAKPTQANAIVATQIAPLLGAAEQRALIKGWWWLNKTDTCGSAVRVRVLVRAPDFLETMHLIARRLAQLGLGVSVIHYEPELCRFGGPAGMQIAHEYFCADSRFLVGWMQNDDPQRVPAIPDGLCLAITLWMLRVAGLDVFESWDVFCRLLDKRGIPIGRGHVTDRFRQLAHGVLDTGPAAVFQLFRGPKATLLKAYSQAIEGIGLNLSHIYHQGRLECGIREFLAAIILFQWNRAAVVGARQAALADATARELRLICVRQRQDAVEDETETP